MESKIDEVSENECDDDVSSRICSRCKQKKNHVFFRNSNVNICLTCSAINRDIREIKTILVSHIENQGIRAPIRDGYVLDLEFERRRYDENMFHKIVRLTMKNKYPNLKFSIADNLEDKYTVYIVNPAHIRYRTDEFFRHNFENMKHNPQDKFTVDDMDNPIPFNEAKKIKIEQNMFDLIHYKLTLINSNNLSYAFEPKLFGTFENRVELTRKINDNDKRDEAVVQLAGQIEEETMREIELPEGCTVFQLLKIIDRNYPQAHETYFGIEGFIEDGDTLKVEWSH